MWSTTSSLKILSYKTARGPIYEAYQFASVGDRRPPVNQVLILIAFYIVEFFGEESEESKKVFETNNANIKRYDKLQMDLKEISSKINKIETDIGLV